MIRTRVVLCRLLGCFAVAGIAAAPASADPAALPSVEAFGQVPAIKDIDINPAGTRLAWIDNNGKLARIVIFDLAAHREVRGMNLPAETVPRTVYWADDATLLASVTVTHSMSGRDIDQLEWQRWFAIDVAGGSPRVLLAKDGRNLEWVTGSTLVRRQTARPGKIFMSSWEYSATHGRSEIGTRIHRGRADSSSVYSLFEVDLKSGNGIALDQGTPFTSDWDVDATGTLAVRSEWDPKRERYSVLAQEGGSWRSLYEAGRCGQLWGLRLAPDKSAAIAVGSICGESRERIWSMPLDGSPMKPLIEDPAIEVVGLISDPLDGTILAVTLPGDDDAERWLDPRAEKRRNGLRRSFGAERVSIYGRSADNQRIVARVEGASRPPVFHFVDYGEKRADIINEAYPGLANIKLGTVRTFKYEARDQYPLVAYLTVPADTPEKNLPLVVLPHGGPEARDDPDFDWWAQFLASRGYAVLQPQFRGSSGFGKAHADAGRRQWGLRMQDDVTDAVRAAIAQGIADPKRVCIVGASYGGYAALAGAAFTPETYACAVSVSGVSDLPLMIGYEGRMASDDESNSLDYWREDIGAVTDPQVIAKSPARAAGRVRAPILLIHGTEDTVVPIEQSRVMAHALKEAGKQFEFVELPGEDHWMSQSTTRIRMLTELERFLAKNLAAPAK